MSLSARRAWIEMVCRIIHMDVTSVSLSARRAWIEILLMWYQCNTVVVALRKESVDRNVGDGINVDFVKLSLSARRAWIEIR